MHPGYGLASHKGYGTPEHRRLLRELGPCALHRRPLLRCEQVVAGEPEPTGFLFDDPLIDEELIEDRQVIEAAELEPC